LLKHEAIPNNCSNLYILYNKLYTLNSFITNYMFILEVSKAKSIISVHMLNIVDQRKKEAISKKKDEKGMIVYWRVLQGILLNRLLLILVGLLAVLGYDKFILSAVRLLSRYFHNVANKYRRSVMDQSKKKGGYLEKKMKKE
jgi:predicted transcriptional regulator